MKFHDLLRLMLPVIWWLTALPAGAQTYSPAEHLSYDAALSESIDEHNSKQVEDRRLIRERYKEEVRLIRELYAQQIKGIKDRKALASYKKERDEKLRQARERRAATDEASEDVLRKKLQDRKAYLRQLPYQKK